MSPETISTPSKKDTQIPNYLIKGELDTNICDITKPFMGNVCVKSSDLPVKSIEIQLVRVETCG